MRQHDPVRTGWLDAAKHAARLDWLVPVLCAAIEICGISVVDDTASLPLLIGTSTICTAAGCGKHGRPLGSAAAAGPRWPVWVRASARPISRAIAHRNR